ncbi:MAG: SIMPL domain-containing protein [Steroidobacteraceae bacterium]
MRILPTLALTAVSSIAIARPPAPPPPGPATLQVTGAARVSEAPDRVYIDIGVTTQAQRSEVATTQNAAKASAIVAAVKRVSGPSAQLTTTEYSVSPDYNYPHDGGTPTIAGYTASNVVRVRLDDLIRIGRIIDAATRAGSNNVRDIRFALRDEQAARTEALREAAVNARQDARALAGALGLRIVRVWSVTEQSPEIAPVPVYPQAMEMRLAAAAPATPVEAGTLDVNATVTLTVEVAPAKR